MQRTNTDTFMRNIMIYCNCSWAQLFLSLLLFLWILSLYLQLLEQRKQGSWCRLSPPHLTPSLWLPCWSVSPCYLWSPGFHGEWQIWLKPGQILTIIPKNIAWDTGYWRQPPNFFCMWIMLQISFVIVLLGNGSDQNWFPWSLVILDQKWRRNNPEVWTHCQMSFRANEAPQTNTLQRTCNLQRTCLSSDLFVLVVGKNTNFMTLNSLHWRVLANSGEFQQNSPQTWKRKRNFCCVVIVKSYIYVCVSRLRVVC